MKKFLTYCLPALLASILFLSIGLPSLTKTAVTDSLFDKNGTPTQNVRQIFEHLGISIISIKDANDFAQANFLRTGERWDAQEQKAWHTLVEQNKTLLLQDFETLGMINELTPKNNKYTYVLLMGATKNTVIIRLDYLAYLKQRGLIFEKIILLGGARLLQDLEKNDLPENITTEAEMMAYLCAQHPILKDDSVALINAPMIQREDGIVTRPTTDSTLVYFAQTTPTDGSCLVISNNPYIIRQTKVAQRILDQNRFPTDGAGKAANLETINIIMLFDELARTIYEEFKSGHQ